MKVTRLPDCEIIDVPNIISMKVSVTGSGELDMDAVKRAEAALKELSGQFDEWFDDEVARLSAARDKVRQDGLAEPQRSELFRAAHDIKGQGETFGYPLAATICASLCTLLESKLPDVRMPLALIDHHVDAVRRVRSEGMKDPANPIGKQVSESLIDAVHGFVERDERKDIAS